VNVYPFIEAENVFLWRFGGPIAAEARLGRCYWRASPGAALTGARIGGQSQPRCLKVRYRPVQTIAMSSSANG
jgi:hypothetical protein